jgi:hypothetical protein
MEISARRATFRESIRRKVAHIKAMLGDLAPDPWQQSPQRDVAHDLTLRNFSKQVSRRCRLFDSR